jgi:DNA-directed RNA polymerase beta' subunit
MCAHCKKVAPTYKNKEGRVYKKLPPIETDSREEFELSAAECLTIFRRINPETMKMMGFNNHLDPDPKYIIHDDLSEKQHIHEVRPENYIITSLLVTPPQTRPFVFQKGQKCDDDLTDKYNQILKVCNKINRNVTSKKRKTKRNVIVDHGKLLNDLEFHITTLMNNKDGLSKLNTGKPHKSFRQRIDTKEGHVQNNIGGKRVDFSARSPIIGGGTMLKYNELGVPRYLCERLSVKEHVNSWNFDYIDSLVKNKRTLRVIRENNGTKITFRMDFVKDGFQIQIGDIVERYLQNGDVIVFNRQPTLRIENFVSFVIKVIEGYAFRLGECFTRGFNADFDGDEMVAHIPQSPTAIAESDILFKAANQLITSQRNGPVNGPIQDTLIGSYILTNTWNSQTEPDTMVSKAVFQQCIMGADLVDAYQPLLCRAKNYYPDYIIRKGSSYDIVDEVPGKLFASILLPANLDYFRRTDTNKMHPIVKIEQGVILPDSGPLCKKAIGAKISIMHILWKEYSPDTALKFVSDAQQLVYHWLPNHGFSFGISDCFLTSKKKIDENLAAMHNKVQNILLKCGGKPDQTIESELNLIVNSAMNAGISIAKRKLVKGDRNAMDIMISSGAKGADINIAQIAAHVGQQNISGGRVPKTISGGSRCLPHFEPDDNTVSARGFISSSYVKGLQPEEAFYHAVSGRKGVTATAIGTAKTGYLHKKMSRKIEDLKILHLHDVRDSSGNIVQFLYGDDGMDPKKLYSVANCEYPLPVNPTNIANRLCRDYDSERGAHTHTKRKLRKGEIHLLLQYIDLKVDDYNTPILRLATDNFRNKLRELLLPIQLYDPLIPDFFQRIQDAYYTSMIQYGDMVGLIAASSIGEPTTQLTLNSVEWHTQICIHTYKGFIYMSIGQWIDDLMKKHGGSIKRIPKNRTDYLEISGVKIPTVSAKGVVSWADVTAVTRHLPNGKLVKIVTRSGRTVTATQSKSFLIWDGCKFEQTPGSDVRVGDHVPVIGRLSSFDIEYRLEYKGCSPYVLSDGLVAIAGCLLSNKSRIVDDHILLYVRDEYIRLIITDWCRTNRVVCQVHDTITITDSNLVKFLTNWLPDKKIPLQLLGVNSDMVKLFLFALIKSAGYMIDSDIYIEHGDVEILGLLYARLSIISKIDNSTIMINKCDYTKIVFDASPRIDLQRDVYLDEIIEISYIDSEHTNVYDLTVPATTNFCIANGLGMADTFHFTGIGKKDVSIGVPRFIEILSTTKSENQKKQSCTVYFKEKYLNVSTHPDDDKQRRRTEYFKYMTDLSKNFEETIVENYLSNIEIMYYEINPQIGTSPVSITQYHEYKKPWWVQLKEQLNNTEYIPINWVIRLVLNPEKMYDKNVTLHDIANAIEDNFQEKMKSSIESPMAECICSPLALATIDIYCNFTSIKKYVETALDIKSGDNIRQTSIVNPDNLAYFVCRDACVECIKKTKITGVENISRATPRQDGKEWVLDLACKSVRKNLSKKRYLQILTMPIVDPYRTICDDMFAIRTIFGIEAARNFLIEEIWRIITFDGTYIDIRHVQLLVDSMCQTGNLTPASRDGISRNVGPAAKIMFEQAVNNAAKAAVYVEKDKMDSLASTIMFGLTSKAGTGMAGVRSQDKIPIKMIRP